MDPQSPYLQLTTESVNGHQVIVVTGEVDLCTSPVLHDYLHDYLHDARRQPRRSGAGSQWPDVHEQQRPDRPDTGRPTGLHPEHRPLLTTPHHPDHPRSLR